MAPKEYKFRPKVHKWRNKVQLETLKLNFELRMGRKGESLHIQLNLQRCSNGKMDYKAARSNDATIGRPTYCAHVQVVMEPAS